MSNPLISIVLCTHNRADMLREALASLASLETNGQFNYEVLVVDNASTDATPQVVETFRATTPWPVRYAAEARKGIAFARNRGVREAAGEWIAFFDDDQLADPRWLWELWAFAAERRLLGVGGTVVLKLPEDCQRELHAKVRMLLGEAIHARDPFAYSHKFTFGTGNLMLHRQVFERIGLFNEVFVARAEDTDLFCRMFAAGIVSWYVPEAIVHHVTPNARLQPAYLEKLARHMGDSIATREWESHSFPRFTFRWLAKTVRWGVWQQPQQWFARIGGHRELELGLHCLNTLSWQYVRSGAKLLKERCQRSFARLGLGQRTLPASSN